MRTRLHACVRACMWGGARVRGCVRVRVWVQREELARIQGIWWGRGAPKGAWGGGRGGGSSRESLGGCYGQSKNISLMISLGENNKRS